VIAERHALCGSAAISKTVNLWKDSGATLVGRSGWQDIMGEQTTKIFRKLRSLDPPSFARLAPAPPFSIGTQLKFRRAELTIE
jgi:hypothetical protein